MNLKHIGDLVAKLNRLNKDRALAADLLELQRMIKGIEKDLANLTQTRIGLTLENERLKHEVKKSRRPPALGAPPAPAPESEPKPEPSGAWLPTNKS